MSCNTPQVIEERILCAKICTEKFNDTPESMFRFEDFVLYDDSQYFDSGDISFRQVKWRLYTEDYLIYEFGFGDYYDIIQELSNGSTYSEFNLGNKNEDILAFIESLPNTIVPNGTKFTIYIDIKDNTGIESQNISNKYCFTK
jgi:hypothetical protein